MLDYYQGITWIVYSTQLLCVVLSIDCFRQAIQANTEIWEERRKEKAESSKKDCSNSNKKLNKSNFTRVDFYMFSSAFYLGTCWFIQYHIFTHSVVNDIKYIPGLA